MDHGENLGNLFSEVYNGYQANSVPITSSVESLNQGVENMKVSDTSLNPHAATLAQVYANIKKEMMQELVSLTVVHVCQKRSL
jgi:hypothetical protein